MFNVKTQQAVLAATALLAVGFASQSAIAASGSKKPAVKTSATTSVKSDTTNETANDQTGTDANASNPKADTATRDPATSPNNPDVHSGAKYGVSATIDTDKSTTPVVVPKGGTK